MSITVTAMAMQQLQITNQLQALNQLQKQGRKAIGAVQL
jgi:hypothetical protein